MGVYVNGNIGEKLRRLEGWMEVEEVGSRNIIGGDFNARTGENGGEIIEERLEGKEEGRKRRSKDKKVNREGRALIEFMEERGWGILNGGIKGDEEGEYTYTGGRGNTVIDYVIGDKETRDRVKRLVIGDKIDSDHHPVEITIGEGVKEREGRRRKNRRKEWRGRWDEQGRESFRQKIGEIESREGVQEDWEEWEERIKNAIEEIEREGGGREGKRGWWDEECKSKKREVRKVLREWRKGKGEEREYKGRKKEYKEMCDKKRKEENEKWIRKAAEAKTEGQVWEVINRGRKEGRGVEEGIEMGEWKTYFMELLGG
ncbi:PREDICTED: uncharacterized protein LOC105562162, partial [Vollenhovia emeryi]|uniref:uncharacterized protein LOC105562162 n=1 Tax=Vollenhovia emeryi TaxID=411798 RepID=UPI0005F4C414